MKADKTPDKKTLKLVAKAMESLKALPSSISLTVEEFYDASEPNVKFWFRKNEIASECVSEMKRRSLSQCD